MFFGCSHSMSHTIYLSFCLCWTSSRFLDSLFTFEMCSEKLISFSTIVFCSENHWNTADRNVSSTLSSAESAPLGTCHYYPAKKNHCLIYLFYFTYIIFLNRTIIRFIWTCLVVMDGYEIAKADNDIACKIGSRCCLNKTVGF